MHSHQVTAEHSRSDAKPDNCAVGERGDQSDAATDIRTGSSQCDYCSSCAPAECAHTSHSCLSDAATRSAQCSSHSPTSSHHKLPEPQGTEPHEGHTAKLLHQRNPRSWPSPAVTRCPETRSSYSCEPGAPSQSPQQTSCRPIPCGAKTSRNSHPCGCSQGLPALPRACGGQNYAQPQNAYSPWVPARPWPSAC